MISRSLILPVFIAISLSACTPSGGPAETRSLPNSRVIDSPSLSTVPGTPTLALSPYGKGREISLFHRLTDGQYRHFKTIQWNGGPTGGGQMAFDSDGNLYLADAGTPWLVGHFVLIFAPPYGSPPTRVSVGINSVADSIAVDPKTGVFAVAATPSNPNGESSVLFFKKGQDTPCATASLSANFAGVEAFDGLGNLFLAEFTGGGYLQFISIAGECNPQPAVTYTPTVRDTVANFAFNTSDQLMIDFDYSIDGSLQTYPHPMNGSLGQPLETTTLNAINGQPAFMLALSANGESIFADSGKQNVYMYHYPAGGDPYEAIKTSLELGSAAVYPASIP